MLTGKNPFEGYIPEVPDGERMDYGSDSFIEHERQGLTTKALHCVLFVNVNLWVSTCLRILSAPSPVMHHVPCA